MALALLAMLWPIGQRTRAAYEYGNAIRLTQTKNFFAATAAMERATQWAPGDAAYWDFLANLQTQTQPLAVIQSRERAVALDRYRPGYHWRLGNDYAVQDGRLSDRARREMDETRRLAPSNPDYRR
jgi:predicted Zn-dependent protease